MPLKRQRQVNIPHEWQPARSELIARIVELIETVNKSADGFLFSKRTLSAASTMVSSDGVILADASAGAFTITALPADQAGEKRVSFKKIDASANKVYIKPDGSDTIEGAALYTLAAQYESVELYSSGASTWWKF